MDELKKTAKYYSPPINRVAFLFSDNLILLWERRYNFRFLTLMNSRKKSILPNYQYFPKSLPHGSALELQTQNKNMDLDSLQELEQ